MPSDTPAVVVVADDDSQVQRVRDLFAAAASRRDVDEPSVQRCPTVGDAAGHLDPATPAVVLLVQDHLAGVDRLAAAAPVVVLTEADADRLGAEAVSRGAQDHLELPSVDPATLDRAVRFAAERWRRERDLRRAGTALADLGERSALDVREEASLVIGRARLLAEHVDHRGEPHVGEIARAGGRLVQLSRAAGEAATAWGRPVDPEPLGIDLGRLVETEVSRARDRYDGASIEVVGELPAVAVHADELLGAVVGNLLAHAVARADPTAPRVVLSVSVDTEGRVVLRVADRELASADAQSGSPLDAVGAELTLVDRAIERYGGARGWVVETESGATTVALALQPVDDAPDAL